MESTRCFPELLHPRHAPELEANKRYHRAHFATPNVMESAGRCPEPLHPPVIEK